VRQVAREHPFAAFQADNAYDLFSPVNVLSKTVRQMEDFKIILAHCLRGQADILQNGQVGEYVGNLERPAYSQVRAPLGRYLGDIIPFIQNASA